MATQSSAAGDTPHPIDDVPQTFMNGDSYDVRDGLEKYISQDLLGPWDGDVEELPPHSAGPRDRYLVGMLGPRPDSSETREKIARAAAQSADSEESGDEGQEESGGLSERLTPQAAGRIWASSMGLSFVVPVSVGLLGVTARWGKYSLTEQMGENGRIARVWGREPVERPEDIDVTVTGGRTLVLDGDKDSGVHLDVQVRQRDSGASGEDLRVVEVALVNRQPEGVGRERDSQWLFQTSLEVVAFPDGKAAVFQPIDDPLDPRSADPYEDEAEERRLRLLYRDELRHALGRNVAVHAEVRTGERHAHRLRTTWLPAYDVRATTAPTDREQPLLSGLELGMDELAALAVPARRAELSAALAPLADGYHAWLAEQRAKAQSLPEDLRRAAEAAVDEAQDVCHRIAFGVAALETDDNALAAFRFANRAMALQRRNSDIAAARAGRETEDASYREAYAQVHAQGKEGASWRPFQLAFVLLNLASLSRPDHPHRSTSRESLVDLLFFPTGGGKTEAYLGLTAFTFALRRLQGIVGTGTDGRDGSGGVAVLMRYTLRLLTAQQFQRAAALVTACEVLRREEVERDARWGETPFRIGLWVGTGVSPNWFEEARDQIAGARESASDKHARVIQVLTCPWCGQGLTAGKNMKADEERRRVLLFCGRSEGEDRCPFSYRKKGDEGIPVLTVDEEIYRLAPAMVIATVDKFAQLPWNGYAGSLFGRVSDRCSRHGYRHADLDEKTGCGGRHNKKGDLPATVSQPVGRLRPPDLIIQDELHLISGSLGTTVGLFESAVDQLCTWTYTTPDGTTHEVGPKIVASTATTKRAAEQVLGVFGRRVTVFPPQVLDVGDTFFSLRVEASREQPGRRYLGICAHGTRLKAAEIRVAEILLLAAQQQFDDYGAPADPYMTLVGYFNATRELAGMRRYMDDDITTRVRTGGTRRGVQKLANRLPVRTRMLSVLELTSRISSSDIGQALRKLETPFDPELDTTARREALQAEFVAAAKEKRNPRVPVDHAFSRAIDTVLATSMLQVGVDVSRFGLMLVVGQPKNTAEYIQASSRVGRDRRRPGLVVTLYNWSRPRDLAHFEDFGHYHATFYRQVEALSVTPYSRRALDRGTAATYLAALRQAEADTSRNTDAHDIDLFGPVASRVDARLLERAERVGGTRARGYLKERIDTLKDTWAEERLKGGILGYRTAKAKDTNVHGLIHRADGSKWDVLTVPMSMRETENEINLLLPAAGNLVDQPTYGGPEWTFQPGDGGGTDGGGAGEPVDADEFGQAAGAAAKGRGRR
ncbi:DISARM system helicase DrmA [Streptomyces laurentii]|uniref:DISARM system helicase DrmA n=1 Tax=Streptomyces laurentii TaxID=39478 RepID=UPI00369AAD89